MSNDSAKKDEISHPNEKVFCPHCGDEHSKYCNQRQPNRPHHCFNCNKDFTLSDSQQSALPPELANMELIPDNMHIPTRMYPEND